MTPYLNQIICGDALQVLRVMPDNLVNCVVTSPPYWRLRDYGVDGQLGLEPTMGEYLEKMVMIFREVKRVLREDGVLWLNLGDKSIHGGGGKRRGKTSAMKNRRIAPRCGCGANVEELKPKDMAGIPWRVAFALQDDGWYLRQDIIWNKPNPMPESVKDRPTRSHEYIFLLSKSRRYYYDADAIKEPASENTHPRGSGVNPKAKPPSGWDTGHGSHNTFKHNSGNPKARFIRSRQNASFSSAVKAPVEYRNKRSVWTVRPYPYSDAHFATFPPDLIKPCILAGAPRGGVVLDPFMGSGTTALVSIDLGRQYVGVELNPEYVAMAKGRINQATRQMELFK